MYGSATAGTSALLKACAPISRTASSAVPGTGADTADSNPKAPPATGLAQAQSSGIKVGLLHSLSGEMAAIEAPVADAERLAIEDINAAGGVLGQPLVPVVEDGASDWPTFAEKAEKLIDQHQVAVIFGGLTTASRKAMLPVVQAKHHLLWYPGAYEGQECSQHIFYAGATANQQIEPALNWMLGNRGKTFFLLSANDRTTHDIAKALLRAKQGKVAGEAFIPFSNRVSADMAPALEDIQQAMPEGGIIFNSLAGRHNRTFFEALKSSGLSPYQYLVMSVRMTEADIFHMGAEWARGHYAAWSYFQTVESPENEKWVAHFQNKYGPDRVVSAPMASAYTMVHLWAQAVEQAQTTDPAAVRAATYGQQFRAPQGPVSVQANHHLTQTIRVGQARADGLFDILWTGPGAIQPNPWSQYLGSSQGFACDWSDPEKGKKFERQAAASPNLLPA